MALQRTHVQKIATLAQLEGEFWSIVAKNHPLDICIGLSEGWVVFTCLGYLQVPEKQIKQLLSSQSVQVLSTARLVEGYSFLTRPLKLVIEARTKSKRC
jgi:energy-converting hydrogenase Eha subunit C